jgi:hypothetical protein
MKRTRKAVVGAACCAAILPLPALATVSPAELVLSDVAGDANGLNDQGSERLVGNVAAPAGSAPEADLLRVRLSPLSERGRTTGWSVAFRVSGDIGPHQQSGEQLAYGLVAQPTEQCRFSVIFTTSDAGRGSAALTDSGGCGGDAGRSGALPAAVDGSVVRIDLPYRLLPRDLQAGTVLRDLQAFTRLVPGGSGAVGEIDGVRARGDFRLPAAGTSEGAALPVRQQVDGAVAVVYGSVLALGPQVVADAHNGSQRYVNGHLTYGFDLDERTVGGQFALGERRDSLRPSTTSQDTYGIVFLDKPLGEAGSHEHAHDDDHHGDGVETGLVPAGARSAYVYATHGLNKSFRYTAVR